MAIPRTMFESWAYMRSQVIKLNKISVFFALKVSNAKKLQFFCAEGLNVIVWFSTNNFMCNCILNWILLSTFCNDLCPASPGEEKPGAPT